MAKTDIKLSEIKSQAKGLYEQNTYELEDGKTITHYIHFPESMIEEMLEELHKHYLTANEKGIELTDKVNLYLIYTLMIKHFTHIGKDMKNTELIGEGRKAGLLDYMKYFVDTGLMKTIIDEVFLQSEVEKVFDKMTDIIGTSLMLEELGEKAQEKFSNLKLKNKEIFESLNKSDTENNTQKRELR